MNIGDITVMGKNLYFQANRGGTLVKLHPPTLWCKFWLQFRDCFKKWEMQEVLDYVARKDKEYNLRASRRNTRSKQ